MEKQLPKNWVECSLSDVFEVVTGNTPSKSFPEYYDGNIPWVKPGDINKSIEIYKTQEFLSNLGFEKSRKIAKGSVMVTCIGNLGNIAIAGTELATNQQINSIVITHNLINKKYVYYRALTFKKWLVENSTSTTIAMVNKSNFEKLPFLLPPLLEQNRIVEKLDNLFNQLETIKACMANIPLLLKDFRQQVLTQAVTGKLTEEWRKGKVLESGENFIRRVVELRKENSSKKTDNLLFKKAEHTFEVDESWSFGYLQYFGEFTRGKSKHRPRNDERLFGGKYPFIQTGEVSRSNGFIKTYTNTYSDFGLEQSRLFPKGTLCITIAANIAETGILEFDACFPDSVVGYLPYENLYTSKFAMYYLRTIQKDLEHYAPATAQKNINLGILFEVPFPVPPHLEQKEIVSRVESLFAKADEIEKQYKILKVNIDNLPQALLNKAFKGKLSEQLESDGDASDLLKKIDKLKNNFTTSIKKKIEGKTSDKKPKIDKKKLLVDSIKKILKEKANGISYKELISNFYYNSQEKLVDDIIQELLLYNIISQEFCTEQKQMLIKINL